VPRHLHWLVEKACFIHSKTPSVAFAARELGLSLFLSVVYSNSYRLFILPLEVTVSKDVPGFLANALLLPFINEVLPAL
jgi:hypothetical protein